MVVQTVAVSRQFPSSPPLPFLVQFEVNYRKVNGAERMPVGWVMMSKHLALPGQQLGSGDANEGTGLHLVPRNELMQLSVSALMNMEITREHPEKQDTDGGVGAVPTAGRYGDRHHVLAVSGSSFHGADILPRLHPDVLSVG